MEIRRALELLAPLLDYPTDSYHDALAACRSAFRGTAYPGAEEPIDRFCEAMEGRSLPEIEEIYTRTFDLNPTCSLDIGWHLYGEQYARGDFLVRMRTALRLHNVDESTELPDHLPSMLRLLGRLDPGSSAELAASAVRPAVTTMVKAFAEGENPYRSLLEAISSLVSCLSPDHEEVPR